jgi:hypothetical protein
VLEQHALLGRHYRRRSLHDPVVYSVAERATGGLSSPVWHIMPVVGQRQNEGGIVDADLESGDD